MTFSDFLKTSIGLGTTSVRDLLTAVLSLAACLLVIRIFSRLLERALRRGRLDARVQHYIVKGVRLLGYFLTLLIVLECLDIHATSLVALLSVSSLGLTLAAEGILGNVAGGLLILSSHPFSIGDFIEVGGVSGTVEEIALNHTRLITLDGLTVLIPNKTLSASQLTNYTALGRRRVVWKVSASYDAPTETVKGACLQAMGRTPGLLAEPAPAVYLTGYGDSAVEYGVYCWANTADYWPAYLTLGEQLRESFAAAGVEMTYRHLNVHVVEGRTGAH